MKKLLLLLAAGLTSCSGDKHPADSQPAAHDSQPAAHDSDPVTHDSDPITHDSDPVTHDSDCEEVTLYYDGDGDGHGDPAVTTTDCEGLPGWSTVGDDCDDADSSIWEDCPTHACALLGEASHPDGGDTGGVEVASAYWACEEAIGWQEARQYCYDHLEADLAALNLPGEVATLQALSAKLRADLIYWIGLSQPDTAPSVDFGWGWVNAQGYPEDTPAAEGGIWHENEPNNGGYDENAGGHLEEDVAVWVSLLEVWAVMDTRVDQDAWFLCEQLQP